MLKMRVGLFLITALLVVAQTATPPETLKSVLLKHMRETHNIKGNWFVPVDIAVGGITPAQADWKDKTGNHSLMELTYHLVYWDERNLRQFKGEQVPKFSGDNEESFRSPLTWDDTVKKFNEVLKGWENAIESADDEKLSKWHSKIDDLIAHNAYHTGEIVYIRRQQGSWNSANGVH
jgi:uncharacterized damage-inducible protein DinB